MSNSSEEKPSINDISSAPFKVDAEEFTDLRVLAQEEAEKYYKEYEEKNSRPRPNKDEERLKFLIWKEEYEERISRVEAEKYFKEYEERTKRAKADPRDEEERLKLLILQAEFEERISRAKAEYEERANRAKADREEERVKVLQQDRQERQKYAKYLFKLICAWLLGIFSIIMFSGFGATTARFDMSDMPVVKRLEFKPSFKLSDAVLLALIGGTTINVLGLFVIVANYLFNSPKDPEDPN